ncbi:hypothetical protein [Amycolatopsis sp. NPDC051903]|uniref:hypothetical protein n=1 Tax=Amycolatopsis sp. NPDC051903 TaxID=3363936 RepID=UPI003790FE83
MPVSWEPLLSLSDWSGSLVLGVPVSCEPLLSSAVPPWAGLLVPEWSEPLSLVAADSGEPLLPFDEPLSVAVLVSEVDAPDGPPWCQSHVDV